MGKLAENSGTMVERIAELLDDNRFDDLGVGGRFGVRGFGVCTEGAVAVVGLRDMGNLLTKGHFFGSGLEGVVAGGQGLSDRKCQGFRNVPLSLEILEESVGTSSGLRSCGWTGNRTNPRGSD